MLQSVAILVRMVKAVVGSDVVWESGRDPSDLTRWEADHVGTPYRAAVPCPIASATSAIAPDAAARADDARSEIARLDAELTSLFADILDEGDDFAPLPTGLLTDLNGYIADLGSYR